MTNVLEVGDHAPDFTLPRSKTEKLTLSDVFEAKAAVLIFYVLDFTSP